MGKKQKTLGGLPLERWINCRVRVSTKKLAGGSHPWAICILKEIKPSGKCVVQPPGHDKLETVEFSELRSHWSENPELKEEAEALAKQVEQTQEALEAQASLKGDDLSNTENPLVEAVRTQLEELMRKELRFTVRELVDDPDMTVGHIESLASAAKSLKDQLGMIEIAVTDFGTASAALDALNKKESDEQT
jgi:hypothetical protein